MHSVYQYPNCPPDAEMLLRTAVLLIAVGVVVAAPGVVLAPRFPFFNARFPAQFTIYTDAEIVSPTSALLINTTNCVVPRGVGIATATRTSTQSFFLRCTALAFDGTATTARLAAGAMTLNDTIMGIDVAPVLSSAMNTTTRYDGQYDPGATPFCYMYPVQGFECAPAATPAPGVPSVTDGVVALTADIHTVVQHPNGPFVMAAAVPGDGAGTGPPGQATTGPGDLPLFHDGTADVVITVRVHMIANLRVSAARDVLRAVAAWCVFATDMPVSMALTPGGPTIDDGLSAVCTGRAAHDISFVVPPGSLTLYSASGTPFVNYGLTVVVPYVTPGSVTATNTTLATLAGLDTSAASTSIRWAALASPTLRQLVVSDATLAPQGVDVLLQAGQLAAALVAAGGTTHGGTTTILVVVVLGATTCPADGTTLTMPTAGCVSRDARSTVLEPIPTQCAWYVPCTLRRCVPINATLVSAALDAGGKTAQRATRSIPCPTKVDPNTALLAVEEATATPSRTPEPTSLPTRSGSRSASMSRSQSRAPTPTRIPSPCATPTPSRSASTSASHSASPSASPTLSTSRTRRPSASTITPMTLYAVGTTHDTCNAPYPLLTVLCQVAHPLLAPLTCTDHVTVGNASCEISTVTSGWAWLIIVTPTRPAVDIVVTVATPPTASSNNASLAAVLVIPFKPTAVLTTWVGGTDTHQTFTDNTTLSVNITWQCALSTPAVTLLTAHVDPWATVAALTTTSTGTAVFVVLFLGPPTSGATLTFSLDAVMGGGTGEGLTTPLSVPIHDGRWGSPSVSRTTSRSRSVTASRTRSKSVTPLSTGTRSLSGTRSVSPASTLSRTTTATGLAQTTPTTTSSQSGSESSLVTRGPSTLASQSANPVPDATVRSADTSSALQSAATTTTLAAVMTLVVTGVAVVALKSGLIGLGGTSATRTALPGSVAPLRYT